MKLNMKDNVSLEFVPVTASYNLLTKGNKTATPHFERTSDKKKKHLKKKKSPYINGINGDISLPWSLVYYSSPLTWVRLTVTNICTAWYEVRLEHFGINNRYTSMLDCWVNSFLSHRCLFFFFNTNILDVSFTLLIKLGRYFVFCQKKSKYTKWIMLNSEHCLDSFYLQSKRVSMIFNNT